MYEGGNTSPTRPADGIDEWVVLHFLNIRVDAARQEMNNERVQGVKSWPRDGRRAQFLRPTPERRPALDRVALPVIY